MRVLIIDDDDSIHKLVSIAVERAGMQVAGVAKSGPEGLVKIADLSPDIITFDMTMPDTDPVATIQQIVTQANRLPILLLTASTKKNEILMALKAGAQRYMAKPFDPIRLAEALKAMAPEANAKAPRLGELLVHDRVISAQQLEEALRLQSETGLKLGACLVQLSFIDKERLASYVFTQASTAAQALSMTVDDAEGPSLGV